MTDTAPAQRPLVAAVVVTWNDVELASDCIASLLQTDYPNVHIILVDNGSIEPCGQRVKRRFPDIELIELPKNRGFTGGSNAGLRRGVAMGAKYIQLYNNDIVVEPDSISLLVDAMEADDSLGATSPLLLAPDEGAGSDLVAFYRGSLDRQLARHDHELVGLSYASREWPDTDSPFVPFCATLFRAEALRDAGYLDESLGTCWEDFDMCVRLNQAGYRIRVIGSARAVHFHGKTTGKASPYIIYYLTRNRLICLARYNSRGSLVLRSPMLARTFGWQLRRYGMDMASHRAFARGVRDFLLGRRGEDPQAQQLRRVDDAECAELLAQPPHALVPLRSPRFGPGEPQTGGASVLGVSQHAHDHAHEPTVVGEHSSAVVTMAVRRANQAVSVVRHDLQSAIIRGVQRARPSPPSDGLVARAEGERDAAYAHPP